MVINYIHFSVSKIGLDKNAKLQDKIDRQCNKVGIFF